MANNPQTLMPPAARSDEASKIILPGYEYTMEEAFPDVPIPMMPFGERVLIQMRNPPQQKNSIILTDYSKDREKDIAQIGKVIAIGPAAFRQRDTGVLWHEQEWFKVGDIVCVPRYGGDRWMEKQADGKTTIQFAIFRELDVIGLVQGDPLAVRTFI